MGLQRCCVFWATSKEPNDQFGYLLSTTNEIGGSNQRKTAKIGKSQRNRVPPRKCPHTSLVIRGKLLEFGWEVMSHPPYSPDFAPSDYHLFRSLQNSLNGKTFTNDDDLKSYLVQFFADKDQKFYERGIMKLPERWQKVIEQNGKYIID